MDFSFQSSIRIRNNGTASASWWFITISQDISDSIKKENFWKPRKWRWSIRVETTIGYLKRETSIFPDKKSGSYLLPIKASIRKELHIKESDTILATIKIIW